MSLHVEFMRHPRSSASHRNQGKGAEKQQDGSLFWWSVAIIVLFGMAVFSWIFSIYIFTHPEKPWTYRLLSRFDKVEKLTEFKEKNMPVGKTYDARGAYQQFYSWGEEQMITQNDLFRRGYLTNYREEKPVYLKGLFKVISSRPLDKKDVFPDGVVVRAVAMSDDKEFHNVQLEYILPAAPGQKAPEITEGALLPVDVSTKTSRLRGRRSYASVLNVNRVDEDTLLFSVVPLLYDTVEMAPQQALKLQPPERLNMDGVWPLTDAAAIPVQTTVAEAR